MDCFVFSRNIIENAQLFYEAFSVRRVNYDKCVCISTGLTSYLEVK